MRTRFHCISWRHSLSPWCSSLVEIVPASPAHVGRIANAIRAIDRLECGAFGHTPKQALRLGLMGSDQAWTAMHDANPIAMFGVVTVSAIEGLARPWLLGSDEVFRHGRDLLALGPRVLERMLDSNRVLTNLVSSGNSRAIRLLGRWGFTVEEREQVIGGTPFREFWIERHV